VAPEVDPPARDLRDLIDDRGDVVELRLDAVAGAVTAGSEPSSVHGVAGEVWGKFVDERC
jgi:hypothetical protein